jgi:hypothetical protein
MMSDLPSLLQRISLGEGTIWRWLEGEKGRRGRDKKKERWEKEGTE